MSLRGMAAWGALILFEALAQASLKEAGDRLANQPFDWHWLPAALGEPWVFVGLFGYVGSFVAWMTILDKVPLSRGFPISSVVAVAVISASVFLFGEQVDMLRASGILLILGGLAVMGQESA